jgi:hypothetical protein
LVQRAVFCTLQTAAEIIGWRARGNLPCWKSVFIRVHQWSKCKNPTAGWQWGSTNLLTQSEPDRRAAQPQRV